MRGGREWGEERPLFLAGALLTRLQPPPPADQAAAAGDEAYDYSVAHIDKANVGASSWPLATSVQRSEL